MTDPVLNFLTDVFSQAGIYSGFIALAVIAINTIVSAFSGKGLSISIN